MGSESPVKMYRLYRENLCDHVTLNDTQYESHEELGMAITAAFRLASFDGLHYVFAAWKVKCIESKGLYFEKE